MEKIKEIKNKIFKNSIQKKKLFLIFLVSSLLMLFNSNYAYAFVDWANMGMKIVNATLYMVYQLSVFIFVAGKWLLDTMTDPGLYSTVFLSPHSIEAINTAWTHVRDFFNMIFILIILMIAICIILRVPKYSDKKFLFYIVLAALLINFSKPIALAIIDASQLTMNYFINAVNGDTFAFTDTFAKNINFDRILNVSDAKVGMGIAVVIVACTIFLLLLGFMFFLLAITLLIRMVAFYVLIILSPFAMFGLALRGTGAGNMSSDWFKKMISWAFFGPVLVFFLWVAVILVKSITEATDSASFQQYFGTSSALKVEGADGKANNTLNLLLGLIIPYAAGIYLLYYGFDLSRKMSLGAANGILNWGEGKMKAWSKKITGGIRRGATAPPKALWKSQLQPRLRGRMEGLGERRNSLGVLKTKEAKEKDRKKKFERSKALAKGEDEGFYKQKIEAKEINERTGELKKENMTKEQMVERLGKTKDKNEKAALAKLIVKEDKIDHDNFSEVIEAASYNPLIKEQVEDSTKKEHVNLLMENEIKEEAKKAGHTKVIKKDDGTEKIEGDIEAFKKEDNKKYKEKTKPVYNKYLKGKDMNYYLRQKDDFLVNEDIQDHIADKYAGALFSERQIQDMERLVAEKHNSPQHFKFVNNFREKVNAKKASGSNKKTSISQQAQDQKSQQAHDQGEAMEHFINSQENQEGRRNQENQEGEQSQNNQSSFNRQRPYYNVDNTKEEKGEE